MPTSPRRPLRPNRSPLLRASKLDDIVWPDKPEEIVQDSSWRCRNRCSIELIDRFDAMALERSRFFASEGVAAILTADGRAREGLLAAEAAGSFRSRDPLAPPTFVVTAEHYGRMVRLSSRSRPCACGSISRSRSPTPTSTAATSSAKSPGGARKDEIVMVGAHFDSWHSGTGATDNGAGSAVMIEVMRILKALN